MVNFLYLVLYSPVRGLKPGGCYIHLLNLNYCTHQSFILKAFHPEEVDEHKECFPHFTHVIQPSRVVCKAKIKSIKLKV